MHNLAHTPSHRFIVVAVLNETTSEKASDVQDWVRACQIQLDRDKLIGAVRAGTVVFQYIPKGGTIPKDAWWCAVLDNADMAEALGYHDITSAGLPLGKVFCKVARTYGEHPSVTLSHELLEMIGDPFVNELVTDGNTPNRFWAKEDCDAVQAVTYDITLPATTTRPSRKVEVSDFVLQRYWNPVATHRPYSFRDALTGPVPTLANGGYMAFFEDGQWDSIAKNSKGKLLHDGGSLLATAQEIASGRLHKPVESNPYARKKLRQDCPIDLRRTTRIIPQRERVLSTTTKVNGGEEPKAPTTGRGTVRPIPKQERRPSTAAKVGR